SAQESLRTTSDAGEPARPSLSDMRENEVLLVGAGISFQSRNFSPTGLSSLPTYSSALYTSIYATGTVYPFALVVRGNKAGLGFFGVFDRAVGLRSQVKASTLLLDTVAQRFEAGAVWKLHFGGRTGLTLRPIVLYGEQKFDIGGMSVMPNTDYKYFGGGMD